MTDLSPDHKFVPTEDVTIDRLLMLHDEIMEVGNGYWVKFEAYRVEPSAPRPHGLKYSLCFFSPADVRLVCFDNAHPVDVGNGPAKRQTDVNDHSHKGTTIRPYDYVNAEKLLVDFWEAVATSLKEEGME